MSEYKHGVYGVIDTSAASAPTSQVDGAIIYVGTAPVHLATDPVPPNKPVLVRNMTEARKYLGYSDNWADYTLCEAMYKHFVLNQVGPLVLINVLDPATHKASGTTTKTITPAGGRVVIADAEKCIISTVAVTGKTAGADYTLAYDFARKTLVISETSAGSLGTSQLTITYSTVDPSAVDADDVIGASDGEGLNTGLYAIKNVEQETGMIPMLLLAPGFSDTKTVHDKMAEVTQKVNGHYDVFFYTDLPLFDSSTALTLTTAAAWKKNNGYTCLNERTFFPMVEGVDGKVYHLSVLAAGNFQTLLNQNGGIPFMTSSNTTEQLIRRLHLGADDSAMRVYDDTLINEKLNKNGICSAAFAGGAWRIWGAHTAQYDQDNADNVNVSETNVLMLYYVSAMFQRGNVQYIDKPLSVNDIQSIVAEQQGNMDALVSIGALILGNVYASDSLDTMSDLMMGDHLFTFEVTVTPLSKSLTGRVVWTNDGFAVYYATEGGEQ